MPARRWLYFGAFVVSGLLLVVVALLGLLDALSVLANPQYYAGELLVLAMVADAAEWVVAAVALSLIAALFLLAAVVSVLRDASIPRSDGLARTVESLESRVPALRRFDVSERVEPTAADRRERLKEQYVEGELSDEEFEAELERLVDDGSGADGPAGTAQTRTSDWQ